MICLKGRWKGSELFCCGLLIIGLNLRRINQFENILIDLFLVRGIKVIFEAPKVVNTSGQGKKPIVPLEDCSILKIASL